MVVQIIEGNQGQALIVGHRQYEYETQQCHPCLSNDEVSKALEQAFADGLQVIPACSVVVVPKSLQDTKDESFQDTQGFYAPWNPYSIYLLPRNWDVDATGDIERIRRDVDGLIEDFRRTGRTKLLAESRPRLLSVRSAVDRLTPNGLISRTIKHEFGHLLHLGYFPTQAETDQIFGNMGYLTLAERRRIIKVGMSDDEKWKQIKEAIAEDFVHTLQNPFFPNVRAPRDFVVGTDAGRGRDIVRKIVSDRVAAGEPLKASSGSVTPMELVKDCSPLSLVSDCLGRLRSGEFDDMFDELEAELSSSSKAD